MAQTNAAGLRLMRSDITNSRFGYLLAVRPLEERINGHIAWDCLCVCGKSVNVIGHYLRGGKKHSCGCMESEHQRLGKTTHGGTESAEYRTWQNMRTRCHNPKTKNFQSYGGRGIAVCDEWRQDFSAFLRDMGERPSPNHSIERIDNGKGYSPGNCRWATVTEQARNRRSNRTLEYLGQVRTIAEWSELTGIRTGAIIRRLNSGWSGYRTLTTLPQEATL